MLFQIGVFPFHLPNLISNVNAGLHLLEARFFVWLSSSLVAIYLPGTKLGPLCTLSHLIFMTTLLVRAVLYLLVVKETETQEVKWLLYVIGKSQDSGYGLVDSACPLFCGLYKTGSFHNYLVCFEDFTSLREHEYMHMCGRQKDYTKTLAVVIPGWWVYGCWEIFFFVFVFSVHEHTCLYFIINMFMLNIELSNWHFQFIVAYF